MRDPPGADVSTTASPSTGLPVEASVAVVERLAPSEAAAAAFGRPIVLCPRQYWISVANVQLTQGWRRPHRCQWGECDGVGRGQGAARKECVHQEATGHGGVD